MRRSTAGDKDRDKDRLAQTQKLLAEGHEALKAGDVQAAMRLYERARSRGLQFSSVLDAMYVERVAACNIANAHHALGNYEQSVEEHSRSLYLAEKAEQEDLIVKQRSNLDAALVSVCTHLFDQGEKATSYTGTALVSYTRALGYGRRILDDGQRRKAERVAYNNVANCLQRLGQYSAAVRLRKRCLKSCVADRDARLAETSRNNLYIALLSEAAERYGMASAPKPRDAMRPDAEEALAVALREAAADSELDHDPILKATVDRFFRSPDLQVDALLCSGVHQVREAAVEWCRQLHQRMHEAASMCPPAPESDLTAPLSARAAAGTRARVSASIRALSAERVAIRLRMC